MLVKVAPAPSSTDCVTAVEILNGSRGEQMRARVRDRGAKDGKTNRITDSESARTFDDVAPARDRPRHCHAAEQRDELAAPCMSRKEHCEG
jgi:hypothetical protein